MKKCDCGDPNCKRESKGTIEGRLYIINHFTCGKVKEQIRQAEKIKVSSHQTDLQGVDSGQLQQHNVMQRSELLVCRFASVRLLRDEKFNEILHKFLN